MRAHAAKRALRRALTSGAPSENRWGNTPLNDAISSGHLDLAEALIKRGASLEMDDITASGELCEMARQGKLERVHRCSRAAARSTPPTTN